MEKYVLSIIITSYNDDQYIEECLQSIIKQGDPQIEIICVDDNSTDETLKKLRTFSKYLNLVELKQNLGLANARNLAIKISKGSYIMFVDGDDYIAKNSIKYFMPILLENKTDLIIGLIEEFKDTVNVPNTWNEPTIDRKIFKGLSNEEILLNLHKYGLKVAPAQKYIIRKSLITKNDLWFENILHEDQLWTPQLLCLANKILYCDFKFYFHRVKLYSLGNRFDEEVCKSYFYICSKLLVFMSLIPDSGKIQFLKERCIYLLNKIDKKIATWSPQRRSLFLNNNNDNILTLLNTFSLDLKNLKLL